MNDYTEAKRKMTLALLALVMAVALLSVATYAWFTLSTNPEITGMNFTVSAQKSILISDELNGEYGKYLPLDWGIDENSVPLPLVPVSTVDGLNWFVCRYDALGNVLNQKQNITYTDSVYQRYYNDQFEYLRFPDGGNGSRPKDNSDTSKYSDGNFWEETKIRNFYVYEDVYLKTTADEVKVRLASGKGGQSDPNEELEGQYRYGTYVLGYRMGEDEQGKPTISLYEGGSETSVRVGFLMVEEYDTDGNPVRDFTEKGKFYILEPNADRRSDAAKNDAETYNADRYVTDFNAKTQIASLFGLADEESPEAAWLRAGGKYIPTYPIRLRKAADSDADDLIDGKTSEERVSEKLESKDNLTVEKKWTVDEYKALAIDGKAMTFPAKNRMVMTSASWKKGENDPVLGLNTDGKPIFDTRNVAKLGSFVKNDSLFTSGRDTVNDFWYADLNVLTANGANTSDISQDLLTLKEGKIVQMRIYFWLEGQDIDCWNDIADVDFLANLEFACEVVK